MKLNISIDPRRIAYILVGIAICLTIASFGVVLVNEMTPLDLSDLTRLFRLNAEQNIPTWYSSMGLLLCSVLLGVISLTYRHDKFRRHWLFLAGLFALMSIDEAVSIHEIAIEPLRTGLNLSGFFYYAWVLPALIFLLVLAIVYFPFFISLPVKTQFFLVFAGFFYVGGAVGLEMAGGYILESGHLLWYAVLTNIEELMEMTGVAIFSYTLLDYLGKRVTALQIYIASPAEAASSVTREQRVIRQ